MEHDISDPSSVSFSLNSPFSFAFRTARCCSVPHGKKKTEMEDTVSLKKGDQIVNSALGILRLLFPITRVSHAVAMRH